MEFDLLAAMLGLLIWIILLLLPWRPWSTRESLDPQENLESDLSDITVLIPARNEALTIAETLTALKQQSPELKVVLVDDQSTDSTVDVANSIKLKHLQIISGTKLPEGWSGKLWALEQGRQYIETHYLILLDADIVLKPALITTTLRMMQQHDLKMLSLMACLKMGSSWEKLLMTAFIFFFKLLYPFHLSNESALNIAAAAGGFILLETKILAQLGGFVCIKDALIDDCALAKRIKQQGYKTWIGLTHSAISIRSYNKLSAIWEMVSRTAYTQLAYSPLLLLVCTFLMVVAFGVPLLALFNDDQTVLIIGLLTLLLQAVCYLPTLRYYSIKPAYTLTLPFSGILYLTMTWSSAFKYYFGSGASWKGRHYH